MRYDEICNERPLNFFGMWATQLRPFEMGVDASRQLADFTNGWVEYGLCFLTFGRHGSITYVTLMLNKHVNAGFRFARTMGDLAR